MLPAQRGHEAFDIVGVIPHHSAHIRWVQRHRASCKEHDPMDIIIDVDNPIGGTVIA